jgi:hypothetical protein
MAIAISMGSCTKARNDVIPDVYVNFTLDINDPEFVNLSAIGSDTVDAQTNNWDQALQGLMEMNIIVYNGGCFLRF